MDVDIDGSKTVPRSCVVLDSCFSGTGSFLKQCANFNKLVQTCFQEYDIMETGTTCEQNVSSDPILDIWR